MAELDESIPVETWTPEDAELALKANTDNYRPLKPSLVDKYYRDMSADPSRWHWTADPIKFDTHGVLIDGQNRLTAQVQAGVTLRWAVARDLPSESTMVVDTGKPRTAADHLYHLGHENANNLAATARRILMDQQVGRKAAGVSVAEINHLVSHDEHLVRIATELVNTVPHVSRVLATSMVTSYVWWRLHKLDPFRANEFFRKLDSLDELPLDSPILALSKRLQAIKRDRGHGQVVNNERVATIIYAWNAWVRNEPRSHLKTVTRRNGQIIIPEPVDPAKVTFSQEQGVESAPEPE